MHCLEVIVARNERAAGREAGHAVNDGDNEKAQRIMEAAGTPDQFMVGYRAARKEN